jgi:hypothetical protein
MKFRTITDQEKLDFYKQHDGGGPELYKMVDQANPDGRPYTQEEWEDLILKHRVHPDAITYDTSWVGNRRAEYPNEDEQLDTIWKALRAIRDGGTSLGAEAEAMLDEMVRIKTAHPKPEGFPTT